MLLSNQVEFVKHGHYRNLYYIIYCSNAFIAIENDKTVNDTSAVYMFHYKTQGIRSN